MVRWKRWLEVGRPPPRFILRPSGPGLCPPHRLDWFLATYVICFARYVLLPAVNACWLPATRCLLPAVYLPSCCPLSAACCLLPASEVRVWPPLCSQPATSLRLPQAASQPPATGFSTKHGKIEINFLNLSIWFGAISISWQRRLWLAAGCRHWFHQTTNFQPTVQT